MPSQTQTSLESRLVDLEYRLLPTHGPAVPSVGAQLARLREDLKALTSLYPPIETGYANLDRMDLWVVEEGERGKVTPIDALQVVLADFDRLSKRVVAISALEAAVHRPSSEPPGEVSPGILAHTEQLQWLTASPGRVRAVVATADQLSAHSLVLGERAFRLQVEKNRFLHEMETRLRAVRRKVEARERASRKETY